MAATVQIVRLTGAQSGAATKTQIDGTNSRFATNDTVSTNDTTNPIKIPADATSGYLGGAKNFSFWQIWRLRCTVAPATLLQSLKFYTDGGNGFGTGVTVKAARIVGTNGSDAAYKQAAGVASVSGEQLTAAWYNSASGSGQPKTLTNPNGTSAGLISASLADAFSYTSGSPLALTGTFTTGTDTAGASIVGDFGDLVAIQFEVANTASAGLSGTAETFTMQFDES